MKTEVEPTQRQLEKSPTRSRTLGQWRGQVHMAEDFDAPLPEATLAVWNGGDSPMETDPEQR